MEKMSAFMNQMFDDIQKRLNENRIILIELQENSTSLFTSTKANDKKIGQHDTYIEKTLKDKVQKMEKEIERL